MNAEELARLEAEVDALAARVAARREVRDALRRGPPPTAPAALASTMLVATLIGGGVGAGVRVATIPAPPGLRACAPITMPPDATIVLERDACYGKCPVYAVTIEASGRVVFDGKAWVETRHAERHLPSSEVSALFTRLVTGCFLEADRFYSGLASDLPRTTLTVSFGGRTQRVQFVEADPPSPGCAMHERLTSFADEIERTTNASEWVGAAELRHAHFGPDEATREPEEAGALAAAPSADAAADAPHLPCRAGDGRRVASCSPVDVDCACDNAPPVVYPKFQVPRTHN